MYSVVQCDISIACKPAPMTQVQIALLMMKMKDKCRKR